MAENSPDDRDQSLEIDGFRIELIAPGGKGFLRETMAYVANMNVQTVQVTSPFVSLTTG